ncbi:MAG: 7-cyano-7-deazaguanine synthase [Nitrospirae bacterium]|nr:7-cyano-7-deazaguanine synthase [Nitrospirota bacterium]
MARAIALLSGGLDSTLSVVIMTRQGIEVTAITFLTHFGCDITDSSSCSGDSSHNAKKFGFELKLCHLSEKFIEIVKNPRYGHGRNMNPCIDCRVLMLKEAKELMRITGADFIITGEVIGQRPMSQRRETFPFIDKEAHVEGYVLRPLSGRLLKPTIPEINGLVSRDKLYAISGRSRKPQIALAKELCLTDYPAPAGGCLLTEPNYSHRLRELLWHAPEPSLNDLYLLRLGRHFRLPSGHKAIVGRNENENKRLERLAGSRDYLMKVEDFGSPITLLEGLGDDNDILISASICSRYSDAKHIRDVRVRVIHGKEVFYLTVNPADDDLIESLRIGKRQWVHAKV